MEGEEKQKSKIYHMSSVVDKWCRGEQNRKGGKEFDDGQRALKGSYLNKNLKWARSWQRLSALGRSMLI